MFFRLGLCLDQAELYEEPERVNRERKESEGEGRLTAFYGLHVVQHGFVNMTVVKATYAIQAL